MRELMRREVCDDLGVRDFEFNVAWGLGWEASTGNEEQCFLSWSVACRHGPKLADCAMQAQRGASADDGGCSHTDMRTRIHIKASVLIRLTADASFVRRLSQVWHMPYGKNYQTRNAILALASRLPRLSLCMFDVFPAACPSRAVGSGWVTHRCRQRLSEAPGCNMVHRYWCRRPGLVAGFVHSLQSGMAYLTVVE